MATLIVKNITEMDLYRLKSALRREADSIHSLSGRYRTAADEVNHDVAHSKLMELYEGAYAEYVHLTNLVTKVIQGFREDK